MDHSPSDPIGSCARCGQPIPLDHPYAWCSACGEPLPEELQARLPRLRKISEDAAADLARIKAEQQTEEAYYGPVEIVGRPLRCLICQHDRFSRREIHVPAALLGDEFENPVVINHVCGKCGFVHRFSQRKRPDAP